MTDPIKPGSVVQLTDDQKECLAAFVEAKKTAYTAFLTASQRLEEVNGKLFSFLRESHPELAGFEFSVNHETGRVHVLGRRLGADETI